MADFTIKRGDTYPYLHLQLIDGAGPIDLSDAAQVVLLLRSTTVVIPAGTMVIDDAPAGRVHYEWTSSDLLQAGAFRGEAEITWANGLVETVPNEGYITVSVVEDLGGTRP